LWIQDQTTLKIVTIPNLPIASTSYTMTVAQALTPGDSFVWYVGAVSTNGQAIAWSNGVNFAIAPLAMPTANLPDSAVTSAQPTFSWTAGSGTATPPGSYELWILDQNTMNLETIPNLAANATSYTLTAAQALTPGDSFLWYVGAVSTNGAAIDWSLGVNFTIQA
jgi:hypothetical protein